MSTTVEDETDNPRYEEITPDDEMLWGDESTIEDDLFTDGEDELSEDFIDKLIDKILQFGEAFTGRSLHTYQVPFARRICQSIIINDGSELTALAARQSGKSEIIGHVMSTLMILLPRLAVMFPDLLGKFKEGVWIGMFAPVEVQVETLYGRTVNFLTSERALEILGDPEIDDITERTPGVTKGIKLRNSGSTLLMMTANPRAKIESKSFHVIIIDECFPYDTPILTSEGWLRIGDVVEGERKDLTVATQDADGNMVFAPIASAYKTERHNELVRVVHEHGTVLCTANHPFAVGDARIPAVDLTPGTPLRMVPGLDQPSGVVPASQAHDADVFSGLLARSGRVHPRGQGEPLSGGESRGAGEQGEIEPQGGRVHAGEQPDAQRRDPSEDVPDLEGHWAPPQGAGGEWTEDARATAEALARFGERVGGRACRPYWRGEGQGRTPDTFQAGSGEPRDNDRRGDRRRVAHDVGEAGAGSPEGAVPEFSRVVRVEVLQQGDPDWDRLGDRVDYVYTLGVDSASHTYVAAGILVGNCQDADDFVVAKSISPMGAYYNATTIKTGTPTMTKNNFYRAIQLNKRLSTQRGARQSHFQWDWKDVAKVNPNYQKFIRKEMVRLGEDSDEFQLSYCCKWLLERGMFVNSSVLDHTSPQTLGDITMETVKLWQKSPCVVGIDPARKADSTVVTVVWVDWDRPDEFGFFEHRVLNWLEIQGADWEEQYFEIINFLNNYDVLAVAVDGNGVGDAVAQRLQVLMPNTEVLAVTSSVGEQSGRYKHLQSLLQRRLVSWPAHSKVRRTRTYRRFIQQMGDAETDFKGPNLEVKAPDEAHAHDDYVDSLSLACSVTKDLTMPTVEVSNNFIMGGRR